MSLRNTLTAAATAVPMIAGTAALAVPANDAQADIVGTLTYTGEVTAVQGNGYDGSGTQVGDNFSLVIDFLNIGLMDDNPDGSIGIYNFEPSDLTYILTIGDNVLSGSAGQMVINDDVLNIFSGLSIAAYINNDGVYGNSNINFGSNITGPSSFGIYSSDSLIDAIGDDTPADFAAFAGDSASNDLQVTRGGSRIHFSLDSLSYTQVPAPGAISLLALGGLAASSRRRGPSMG